MSVLDNEKQLVVMDGVIHEARMAYQEIMYTNSAPHVVHRVVPVPDGDQWCCLLGSNLQEGIAGFGDTPAKAAAAFDTAWHESVTPAAALRLAKGADHAE